MVNNLQKIKIGAFVNRDLEIFKKVKRSLAFYYGINVINLLKNNGFNHHEKHLIKKAKKHSFSFLIVKLTTSEYNKIVYDIIEKYLPNIPILNDLSAIQTCESRKKTFELLKEKCPTIKIPEFYGNFTQALRAIEEGKQVIVKLDSHNIPHLPKRLRIVGIADTAKQLNELVQSYNKNQLFFQEFLGYAEIIHKIYAIGNWMVSLQSPNRLLKRKLHLQSKSSRIRVKIDSDFKRQLINLELQFKMPIFGVDYIQMKDGPYIIDINDFPSFKNVPESTRLISEYVYSRINLEQQSIRKLVKAKV
ncbi:MAG: hypothetical protein ACTSUX_11190 [Promethearchaeota archaeon]